MEQLIDLPQGDLDSVGLCGMSGHRAMIGNAGRKSSVKPGGGSRTRYCVPRFR